MAKKMLLLTTLIFICTSFFVMSKNKSEEEKLCDLHEKYAKQGKVVNQNLLSICYRFGRGRTQDTQKAIYWSKLAANKGSKPAIESLSTMYLSDEKYKVEFPGAIKSLKKLLNENYGRAGVILSVVYHKGIVSNVDNDLAIEYLEKAAYMNTLEAIAGMYYIYKHGLLGKEVDLQEANKWFQKLETYTVNYSIRYTKREKIFHDFSLEKFKKMMERLR